ncbi:hypothetical protein [Rhizobium jaguaris]|uniref:Uncharacterized protein n=1 Tax=Rhizobium jaguaris TaxID=1312183 RepID=A0A387FNG6_9HYPH|nr:hypothetical protein [Rhizobium jaguaris]AYG59923.1 hypothetical protein CCGE525_14735 [Rhizobium jaguaris]
MRMDASRKHYFLAITLRLFMPISLGGLCLIGADGIAQADNIVDRAIAAAQPCSSLKVKAGFVTVGVDKFESVDVKAASVDIQGNTANVSLNASLACKTSDQAVMKGDVSATFAIKAQVDLGTCVVTSNDVQIIDTGGTFKKFIDALKPQIQEGLKGGLPQQLTKLCKQ